MIWDYLKKNDIESIISNLTGIEKGKFQTFAGGNLLFPYPKVIIKFFTQMVKRNQEKLY